MISVLTVGKYLTLGLWVLPVLVLCGVLDSPLDYYVLWGTALLFFAHVGELLIVQGKLKNHGRNTSIDGLMVILVGLFHWVPIVRAEKN